MPELGEFEALTGPSKEERLRAERDEWKRQYEGMQRAFRRLEQKCDLLTAIDSVTSDASPWPEPTKPKKQSHGISNLLLSDLHFDEVTPAAAVSHTNAYNRQIARLRLERLAEKYLSLHRDHIAGITWDGACIWMNGDIFSGVIHEELKRTNEAPIMASFDYWLDPMAAFLRTVLASFGTLHIVVRVGNHGRENRDKIYKGAVEDNWDWLFGRVLQRELRGCAGLTWDIPLATEGIVSQYGTRYLATHGNQFRGGSGISGILTPLSLGHYRKTRRQASIAEPYDVMVLGHFHSYMTIPGVIVNGSLKGTDEYAWEHNFGYEPPRQASWITTPEHGPAFHVPIEPSTRKRENW